MRFVAALFIALIAAAPVRAQTHSVEVRTLHDGQPLRASVRLGASDTLADSLGIARFRVAAGTYELTAIALGYRTAVLTLTVLLLCSPRTA